MAWASNGTIGDTMVHSWRISQEGALRGDTEASTSVLNDQGKRNFSKLFDLWVLIMQKPEVGERGWVIRSLPLSPRH